VGDPPAQPGRHAAKKGTGRASLWDGKWYDGALFFLCREKEMVRTEMALSLLGYNLRRAINLLGAGALVAHFNARNRKNRE